MDEAVKKRYSEQFFVAGARGFSGIRRLQERELGEAIQFCASSCVSDRTSLFEKTFPEEWDFESFVDYYTRIFHSVFSEPETVFLGKFFEGKLVGVVYCTSLSAWLVNAGKGKEAFAERAVKLLGLIASDKVGYLGGLAVAEEFKGRGFGRELIAAATRVARENYSGAVAYYYEGLKSKGLLEEQGFRLLFSHGVEGEPVQCWTGARFHGKTEK
jgi:ribosomal protein S18 acetylase RimI-like enzyme